MNKRVSDDQIAQIALASFEQFRAEFSSITSGAVTRFSSRDWSGLQEDAVARLELYNAQIDQVVEALVAAFGPDGPARAEWESAHQEFAEELREDSGAEIGKTFFSSITPASTKDRGD